MTCTNRNEQLNALLDGELAADDAAALVAHLADCPACAKTLADLAGLRSALAQALPPKEATPDFIARIEASLAAESSREERAHVIPFARNLPRKRLAWTGAVAAAALAATLAIAVLPRDDKSLDLMAVRDADLRGATTQIDASKSETPVVPGFQLASARSDIVAGRRAQVLVYTRDGTSVTLCIWSANGEAAHGLRKADYQGAAIDYWNDGKREFWAVSGAGRSAALSDFVQAMTTI